MKNRRIIMICALLIGVLFINACKNGNRQSLTIPFLLAALGLSESTYNYSGVVVNNIADRDFTITNVGTKDGLVVTGFSSDAAEFTIISESCTAQSLAQGASCSFTVRFSPTVQGTFRANISIASNNILPSGVSVSGEGYGLNVWINKADFANCSDVQVDVTVTDTAGAVNSLNAGSFTLWQGDFQKTITGFETLDNSDPVSVVVALDLSSSLTAALPNVRTGANTFIGKLNNYDEAAVFAFKRDILYFPTSSPLLIATDAAGILNLQNFIDAANPATEGTALYDAVYDSIARAASGNNSKKAVIVLSDGDDQSSTRATLQQVIDYAKAQNVALFTIFYVDPDFAANAEPSVLRQMADGSGGQDYYAQTSTMESIFTQIRNILGSKYVIHYNASPFCTGSIPLKVQAVRSDGQYGIDSRTFTNP